MSVANPKRAAEQEKPRPHASADALGGSAELPYRSALEASAALVAAAYHLLGALRKLAAAEGRVFRASVPLLLIAGAALVMFGATLWLCLVALFGWLLMMATGSLGLALGLLVLMHAVLIVGVGPILLFWLRQAAFPRTRTELRLLSRTLRYDIGRATGAIEDPLRPPPSANRSTEKGTV